MKDNVQASTPRGRTGNPAPGGASAWPAGPLAAGLGLAAHLGGGGLSPAAPVVVALAALLGLAAVLLERLAPARLPGWAILVASAVAQQLLHLAFAAFSTAGAVPLPDHMHGGLPAPDVPSSPAVPADHSLHLMLYLHAAAALLVAAAVAQWGRFTGWARASLRM